MKAPGCRMPECSRVPAHSKVQAVFPRAAMALLNKTGTQPGEKLKLLQRVKDNIILNLKCVYFNQ